MITKNKWERVKELINKIKDWWEGYLVPYDDHENDIVIFPPYIQRPFLARCWESISNFYLNHWLWIWTTAIAVATAFFTASKG